MSMAFKQLAYDCVQNGEPELHHIAALHRSHATT